MIYYLSKRVRVTFTGRNGLVLGSRSSSRQRTVHVHEGSKGTKDCTCKNEREKSPNAQLYGQRLCVILDAPIVCVTAIHGIRGVIGYYALLTPAIGFSGGKARAGDQNFNIANLSVTPRNATCYHAAIMHEAESKTTALPT